MIGSATLDADGNAVLSTNMLPAGIPAVTASYEGPRTSSAAPTRWSQDVAQASPEVEIATANPTTVAGEAVTFIGSVLPVVPGSLVPTGTATFYDESTDMTLATDVPLVNGQAVLTLSTLGVGSHPILFTYDSGDNNYDPNTDGATATLTVDSLAASTAALTPTSASVAYGQAGTYVVTLTGTDDAAPSGSVQLDLDGAFYSQATLVAGEGATATATFNVNGLDPATYSLQASYGGDSNYLPAQTGTASLTVAAATTQVTGVSSSISSPTVGATISLSAQVSVTTGAGTPIGMVVFLDTTDPSNPIVLGRADVLNGVAVLDNVSFVNAGVHDVTAEYQPQGSDFAGSSASTSIDVNVIATTLQLLAPTIAYTQSSVTLTAMVAAPGVVNVGTVSFYDNGVFIGSSPVNRAGVATLSVTDLSQGTQNFTAAYVDPPDTSFGSSTTSIVFTTNIVPNPLTPVTVATRSPSRRSTCRRPRRCRPPSAGGTRGSSSRSSSSTRCRHPDADRHGHRLCQRQADRDVQPGPQGTATIVLDGQDGLQQDYRREVQRQHPGDHDVHAEHLVAVRRRPGLLLRQQPAGRESTTVKKSVHPAGPAKFLKASHKAKVKVPAVHTKVPIRKVRVLPHHTRS